MKVIASSRERSNVCYFVGDRDTSHNNTISLSHDHYLLLPNRSIIRNEKESVDATTSAGVVENCCRMFKQLSICQQNGGKNTTMAGCYASYPALPRPSDSRRYA
ncbi:hypothetical protein X798_04057 [Onchocerca flexuosa]|uniref:Uncharacterized protein n=1 Tax=Onchocerca flexuosa TaxID=387005 RepID=A0A238BWD2_9BILA|nr:hypothetical protein X798_04057 [Onchocerca flexuosa]